MYYINKVVNHKAYVIDTKDNVGEWVSFNQILSLYNAGVDIKGVHENGIDSISIEIYDYVNSNVLSKLMMLKNLEVEIDNDYISRINFRHFSDESFVMRLSDYATSYVCNVYKELIRIDRQVEHLQKLVLVFDDRLNHLDFSLKGMISDRPIVNLYIDIHEITIKSLYNRVINILKKSVKYATDDFVRNNIIDLPDRKIMFMTDYYVFYKSVNNIGKMDLFCDSEFDNYYSRMRFNSLLPRAYSSSYMTELPGYDDIRQLIDSVGYYEEFRNVLQKCDAGTGMAFKVIPVAQVVPKWGCRKDIRSYVGKTYSVDANGLFRYLLYGGKNSDLIKKFIEYLEDIVIKIYT